jgi:hypothetical protein
MRAIYHHLRGVVDSDGRLRADSRKVPAKSSSGRNPSVHHGFEIRPGWGARSFMEAIGRRRRAIAEGDIPSESAFTDCALISDETAYILNVSERDAQIGITIFFANHEPVGPYRGGAGLSPMCQSSCSTSGSTRGERISHCSQPWPIRRADVTRSATLRVDRPFSFIPLCVHLRHGTIAVQRR